MRRLRTSLPRRRAAVCGHPGRGRRRRRSNHPEAPILSPIPSNLKPTGDSALDAALNGSLHLLISLEKSAPVGGFALTERARQDAARFETALTKFRLLQGDRVATTIAGHVLTDPTLPTTIDQAPANPPLEVAVSFDLGPRFELGSVSISTPVPPAVAAHLDLKPGQPAMAAQILAAQGRLLDALRRTATHWQR